jgi:hypothetical protein
MNSSGRTRIDVAMRETTRRVALKLAGGAALLAFAGAGSGRAALAQEASPVASPAGGNGLNGKYVVIRIRERGSGVGRSSVCGCFRRQGRGG